jgi:osmotically-inducible protein OsmY
VLNEDGVVMPRFQGHRRALWTAIGLVFVLLCQACASDRYKAVSDAAEAGFSSLTMADDYRHQRRLQEALLAEPGFAGLVLTSYVFMEHGYVVGHVNSPEQAGAIYQVASKVQGLRSLNAFLPVKRPSTFGTVGKVTPDESLKAQVQDALARTPGLVDSRVHVEVLDERAILLGVVSGSEEKSRAEHAVASTLGVRRIVNWLLLPESDYLAIRSQVF